MSVFVLITESMYQIIFRSLVIKESGKTFLMERNEEFFFVSIFYFLVYVYDSFCRFFREINFKAEKRIKLNEKHFTFFFHGYSRGSC